MKPYRLHKSDGTPTNVFACGVCNIVKANEQIAEACCVPVDCVYCGKPIDDRKKHHYQKYHSECWSGYHRQREMERLEEAELVEYEGGMLYADHLPGGRDGYFDDMESILDSIGDAEEEGDDHLVRFAFCTTPNQHGVDLGRVLEDACSDGYEDMEESLDGVDELGKAIDAFNELNKAAMLTYHVDCKRKVEVK